MQEKIYISQNYTLPKIYNDIGFSNGDIKINKSVIEYIVTNYTNEVGIRKLNEKLYDIFRNINLEYVKTGKIGKITVEFIDKLFDNKKNKQEKILHKSQVGVINGLYAGYYEGMGGLLQIEIVKNKLKYSFYSSFYHLFLYILFYVLNIYILFFI
jgi:ATP-dependent Lon protease